VGTSVAPVAVGTGAAHDGGMAVSMERQMWSAVPVQSLVCVYQERLDLTVDGQAVERIRTPWS
jgi:hypothetical protein